MSKSKWNVMLLALALPFGVMACSAPASESGTVDEAPGEEVTAEAPTEEAAAEAPACGTFSFVVDAEYPAQVDGGQVIDRQATVVSVNRPGDAAFDTMTVDNGNRVEGTKYEPTTDDLDVGIAAGTTYNMFMITQEDDTQAFIVWSPEDPVSVIPGSGESRSNKDAGA